MENFNAPFRFDYVGSFLRPEHLKQARADFEAGKITKAELESIENEAITDLIKKQKAAGYPVITDGEFRRSYWHLDFMWGLEGIEHIELDHGYFFHGEETTHGSVRVTGKISGEQHPFVNISNLSNSLRMSTPLQDRPFPHLPSFLQNSSGKTMEHRLWPYIQIWKN